jgi:hypothetical protein
MAPKGLGRPKNQIHTLYKKVTGQGHAANNPHFECIGCDADVLGKELSKLCAHSTHCTYLTDEQRELAGTCFTRALTSAWTRSWMTTLLMICWPVDCWLWI